MSVRIIIEIQFKRKTLEGSSLHNIDHRKIQCDFET